MSCPPLIATLFLPFSSFSCLIFSFPSLKHTCTSISHYNFHVQLKLERKEGSKQATFSSFVQTDYGSVWYHLFSRIDISAVAQVQHILLHSVLPCSHLSTFVVTVCIFSPSILYHFEWNSTLNPVSNVNYKQHSVTRKWYKKVSKLFTSSCCHIYHSQCI